MSEKAAVIKGHGHVTPNADGSRTRCGGPTICKVCKAELAALKSQPRAEQTLLDALEKISAYAPCSGIKDPGFTKMHMGILARDAIAQHQRILDAATHPADQVAAPVLERPAKVGAGTFAAGLPTRMVVEAAYRQYEYAQDPPFTDEQIAAVAKSLSPGNQRVSPPEPLLAPSHPLDAVSVQLGLLSAALSENDSIERTLAQRELRALLNGGQE